MNALKILKSGGILLTTALSLLAAQSSHAAALLQIRPVLAEGAEQTPPPGAERMQLLQTNTATGAVFGQTLWIGQSVLLDQNDVQSAYATTNDYGRPIIDVTFTPEGKERFAAATRQNLNKKLAIIIQGRLVEAPLVRDEIRGGKAQIDGNFTMQQIGDLARKIDNASRTHSTGPGR